VKLLQGILIAVAFCAYALVVAAALLRGKH
jgi:hypothetical protein